MLGRCRPVQGPVDDRPDPLGVEQARAAAEHQEQRPQRQPRATPAGPARSAARSTTFEGSLNTGGGGGRVGSAGRTGSARRGAGGGGGRGGWRGRSECGRRGRLAGMGMPESRGPHTLTDAGRDRQPGRGGSAPHAGGSGRDRFRPRAPISLPVLAASPLAARIRCAVAPAAFLLFPVLHAQTAPPEDQGDVFSVDLARTPARVSGGVKRFVPAGPDRGTLTVKLRGGLLAPAGQVGRGALRPAAHAHRPRPLEQPQPACRPRSGSRPLSWARASATGTARTGPACSPSTRAAAGSTCPTPPSSTAPRSNDGWLDLARAAHHRRAHPPGPRRQGASTSARITGLGLNVEAFNREGETVAGTIELRHLRVTFEPTVTPRLLPPHPAIRAGEAERSAGMDARLIQRCGLRPGQMAVGVNLAWPTAPSPDGEEMQLYGRILDGGTPWYNRLWDVGEEAVAFSVRNDFREIRETFGPGRGGAAVAVRRPAQRPGPRRRGRSGGRQRAGPRRTCTACCAWRSRSRWCCCRCCSTSRWPTAWCAPAPTAPGR